MAIMIPPVFPSGAPPGEQEVFRRLADDPAARDWIVLHSLDIGSHVTQVSGEADFIVIVPGLGVAVLEVKSHLMIHRDHRGLWFFGKDTKGETRSPFRQAADAMHSIRRIIQDRLPELNGMIFWSAVVLPKATLRTEPSTEWLPWQLIDAAKFRSAPFSKLVVSVLESARKHIQAQGKTWYRDGEPLPSLAQSHDVAKVLKPVFEAYQSPTARVRSLNEDLKAYTDEQAEYLDLLAETPRVLLKGPAGTGKTVLALEAARRAANEGRNTLLICFNKLLGNYLASKTQACERIRTTSFHRFLVEVVGGVTAADASHEGFWSAELPAKAAEALLLREGPDTNFDELVVDEMQDLLQSPYLDILDLVLRGGLAAGRWRAFGDFERQAIYGPGHLTIRDLVARGGGAAVFQLTVNCRNTPRIAEYTRQLGQLNPFYQHIRRPDDGIDPELKIYKSEEDECAILCALLTGLRAEGYGSSEVIILSPRKEGCASRLQATGAGSVRVQPFPVESGDAWAFATIQAFKGLEAPVVIITDIEHLTKTEQADLFYIGTTRALQRLSILASQSARSEIIALLSTA